MAEDKNIITIHDTDGNELLSTLPNIGAKRIRRFMADDCIQLPFKLAEAVRFDTGDWCMVSGAGRFELCEPYYPAYNDETCAYEYDLKLEAQYMKWRNKLMRYMPAVGGQETSFTLTAVPQVHLEQVIANVNTLAHADASYLYHPETGAATEWKGVVMEEHAGVAAKTILYDSTNIIDALSQIAETFECEWWVEGDTVYLGKCLKDALGYADFINGENVHGMTRDQSQEKHANRIIPYGGTRNISPRYRKDLVFDVSYNRDGCIWDAVRPLRGDWFAESLARSYKNGSYPPFTGEGGSTVDFSKASSKDGQVHTLFSRSKTLGKVGTGTFHVDGSRFRVKCYFTTPFGGGTVTVRYGLMVTGRAADGTAVILYSHSGSACPTTSGGNSEHTLQSADVEVASEVTDVKVSFSASYSCASPTQFGKLNVDTAGSMTFGISSDLYSIPGITVQPIKADGTDNGSPITGCVFNPSMTDDAEGRNRLKVPNPSDPRIAAGCRFRIPSAQLLPYKVKSSYFTERYCAYEGMDTIIKNGVVTRRLMLPESRRKPYIDSTEDATPSSEAPTLPLPRAVEDVVTFDDIYPRAEMVAEEIQTGTAHYMQQNDDGTESRVQYTTYLCVESKVFNPQRPWRSDRYLIPDIDAEITFLDVDRWTQSDKDTHPGDASIVVGMPKHPEVAGGLLNGMTFKVNPRELRSNDGTSVWAWEIVRDDKTDLPNEILRPHPGDKFVITGIDVSVIDEAYVGIAENELLEKAKLYVQKLNTDASTYNCPLDARDAKTLIEADTSNDGKLFALAYGLGQPINLVHEGYFKSEADAEGRIWGRKSRVIGYEIPLDIPYDNPVFIIGEKPSYSRFGAIEDSIEALRYSMAATKGSASAHVSSSTSGGQTVSTAAVTDILLSRIIKEKDTTPPADDNTFSALRTLRDFCRKAYEETVTAAWKFTKRLHLAGGFTSDGDAAVNGYTRLGGGATVGSEDDSHNLHVYGGTFTHGYSETDGNSLVKGNAAVRGTANIGGEVNVGQNATLHRHLDVKGNAEVGGWVTADRNGFRTKDFTQGSHGAAMYRDGEDTYVEADFFTARKKFKAVSVEIDRTDHAGGALLLTPAAAECVYARILTDASGNATAWRAYFLADDAEGHEITNDFALSDLVRCQTWNLVRDADGFVGNRYWWRTVVAVSPSGGVVMEGSMIEASQLPQYRHLVGRRCHYIDVSLSDTGSCGVSAGDVMVTLGNADSVNHPDRQNAIMLSANGSSPFIHQYRGISSYSLDESRCPVKISPSGNKFTGEVRIIIDGKERDILTQLDILEERVRLSIASQGDTVNLLQPAFSATESWGQHIGEGEGWLSQMPVLDESGNVLEPVERVDNFWALVCTKQPTASDRYPTVNANFYCKGATSYDRLPVAVKEGEKYCFSTVLVNPWTESFVKGVTSRPPYNNDGYIFFTIGFVYRAAADPSQPQYLNWRTPVKFDGRREILVKQTFEAPCDAHGTIYVSTPPMPEGQTAMRLHFGNMMLNHGTEAKPFNASVLLSQRQAEMLATINGLRTTITANTQNIDSLTGRVKQSETNISQLTQTASGISTEVASFKTSYVQDMNAMMEQLDGISDEIGGLDNDLAALGAAVGLNAQLIEDNRTAIEQTAKKLSLEVSGLTQAIADAESRARSHADDGDKSLSASLTQAYKAAINLSEQGIRQTVEQKVSAAVSSANSHAESEDDRNRDEITAEYKSEIKQTAQSISMEISESVGYANLLYPLYATRDKWIASNAAGRVVTDAPHTNIAGCTDYAFRLDTIMSKVTESVKSGAFMFRQQGASAWQQCPIELRKGETVTFSFRVNRPSWWWDYRAAGKLAEFRIGMNIPYSPADGEPLVWTGGTWSGDQCDTFVNDLQAVWHTVVKRFTAPCDCRCTLQIEMPFPLEGRTADYGIFIDLPMCNKGTIALPFVGMSEEERIVRNGLLATGIDISARKVTVTADTMEVRNNKGEMSAVFNADGSLNASLINTAQLDARELNARGDDGCGISIGMATSGGDSGTYVQEYWALKSSGSGTYRQVVQGLSTVRVEDSSGKMLSIPVFVRGFDEQGSLKWWISCEDGMRGSVADYGSYTFEQFTAMRQRDQSKLWPQGTLPAASDGDSQTLYRLNSSASTNAEAKAKNGYVGTKASDFTTFKNNLADGRYFRLYSSHAIEREFLDGGGAVVWKVYYDNAEYWLFNAGRPTLHTYDKVERSRIKSGYDPNAQPLIPMPVDPDDPGLINPLSEPVVDI